MSLLRSLSRGLRVLTRRSVADLDVDEEVRHFLDQASADEIARGVDPVEARRAARLAFGDAVAIREQVRDNGWEHVVETAFGDLRYALRGVRRRPGFAIVVTLTLALGIGAATAIFSAVDPILFQPLPYPHAERIALIADRGTNGEPIDVTYGTYRELVERSRSFSSIAIADLWQPALMGLAEPERLLGDCVTARYFQTMGIVPVVGRDFEERDDLPGAPRVVIVSDGFARRHFGSDAAAVGRPIVLDGDEYTMIGVTPLGFDNVLRPSADVWTPRRYQPRAPFQSPEWGHHLRMVGRLAPGVSVDQARREALEIGHSPLAAFPRPAWAAMTNGLQIVSLQAAVTAGVRPALLAILAAVAIVMATAGVNVTNLLLARGAQRRGEFAMRAALGAGRGRLARQLLTESVVLAAGGGVLGLGVAAVGVRTLVALAPEGLPRVGAIRLDATAFAFAAALTTLIGVAVGLYPALHGAARDPEISLQPGTRIAGAGSHALRRWLVVAEVALALVMLVGTALMLRSLAHLFAIAPGFESSHVLTMQVEAAGRRYDPDSERYQFFDQALDAVRNTPGVLGAAFTSQLPLSGDLDSYGIELEAVQGRNRNDLPPVLRYAVTPGWFQVMGIPLYRGRFLDGHDRPGALEAIVISASLARAAFPGKDPIGQRLRVGPEIGSADRPWDLVVGVVGDVKQTSLGPGPQEAIYVTMGQWSWVDNVQSLVVRTANEPTALVADVKRAIWSVDRNQPIIRTASMDELVARSEAQRHFVLTVFGAFGLAALALAAIGIYGMVSNGVTERLTELGVRAALGASRSGIVMLVLRQGLTLAVIGIAVGIGGAALLSGALRTLVFGVSRADLASYSGAAALILVIALAASAIPAWRAARVDPTVALRQ